MTLRGSVAHRVRNGSSTEVAISLRVKAMAGVALLIAASAGVIGFSVLSVTRAEMTRAYETRLDAVVDATAHSVAPALMPEPDRTEITRIAQGAIKTDGVVFCAVFSSAGELLGLGGLPVFEKPLWSTLQHLDAMSLHAQHLVTRNGEEIFLKAVSVIARAPRDHGGTQELANVEIGSLLLGCINTPVDSDVAALESRIWTIVCGVAAATALIAWLVARSLVRPIHALLAGTERIVAGDFDHRVKVGTHDELELLANSFNAMTAELGESRARLARQTQMLEEAVRQRTRKLRAAYAEMRVLDKLKDGFLSSISHEFRTPITTIRASAEILEHDPDMDVATRREFAGMIVHESERLGHLVSDVLDLVKLESGETPFRFAAAQPAALVEAARQQVVARADEKRITIAIAVDGAPQQALWDSAKVTRLLVELLDNAIHFAPPGGHVWVAVTSMTATSAATDELARIDIRDDGPGIPATDLATVFEKFHQSGEILTGKPQGQGLGLPLCRLIAARHGGQVVAQPSDRGAHLVVELPLTPPAQAPS